MLIIEVPVFISVAAAAYFFYQQYSMRRGWGIIFFFFLIARMTTIDAKMTTKHFISNISFTFSMFFMNEYTKCFKLCYNNRVNYEVSKWSRKNIAK